MYSPIIDTNATRLFQRAFNAVTQDGETVESRIGRTKHLTNVTLVLTDPLQGICFDKARNLSLRYMLGEIQWYMSGSNKVSDIGKYAKMWYDLTDDGETVNSAYGYRIFHKFGFDQLQFVIDKLKANPHDRQAVIHIKDASNAPTKDTPCTCLLQFTVFKGKLNLHTYMRSNDIWLGLPYDMAFFTSLQHIVSQETGIPLGEYHHTVGDLHLYERHWEKPVGEVVDSIVYHLRWNYARTNPEEIASILDRSEPRDLALNYLWRMNNAEKD